jgi:Peptidase_C39 like family
VTKINCWQNSQNSMSLPFYSQKATDVPKDWQYRACGVASLRMAIEAKVGKAKNTEELINEGVKIGAYLPGIGWKHDGLITLAKNNGAQGYRKEFPDKAEGIEYLRQAIKRGEYPIVSVRVDGLADSHLVVLSEYGEQGGTRGFFYNDPAKEDSKSGAHIFISLDEFTRLWRGLAVFIL